MPHESGGIAKRLQLLIWPIMVGLSLAFAYLGLQCRYAPRVQGTAAQEVICRAELRSWIVFGMGRHLYLEIHCPDANGTSTERLEYTTLINRSDYRYTSDKSGEPRVGRHKGSHLRPPPMAPIPDGRLEAVYDVTLDQAMCLRKDRVFDRPYMLVGANSNSGLRRVMEGCGLTLPAHVLAGFGLFGAFPGIDAEPGAELPEAKWNEFGIRPD